MAQIAGIPDADAAQDQPSVRDRWKAFPRQHPIATVVLCVLVMSTIGALIWTYFAERERVSGVTVLNESSAHGTALVVYHPGLTDFQERVAGSFADGLVAAGWRVEVTTASHAAPRDVGAYDLLVVSSPTYWWTPAWPVTRYVERVDGLNGKHAAIIVTASGMGTRAMQVLRDNVEDNGGIVTSALTLYTWRPNDERAEGDNKQIAVDIAYREAAGIAPPR
jgi:hypothetical protein